VVSVRGNKYPWQEHFNDFFMKGKRVIITGQYFVHPAPLPFRIAASRNAFCAMVKEEI
jgi:hypothetical protein